MSLTRFQPFFADSNPIFFDERLWSLTHPKKHIPVRTPIASPELHADIIEREGDYQIHVDLPGYDKNDIEIIVANGAIHIKAERKQVHEEKHELSHKIERRYGLAQRSIPLPENALLETAEANFDHGVMTVQFTKRSGSAIAKKLEVKSGPQSESI